MNFNNGIGLGLLKFCLQHSDGNVGESVLPDRPAADYEWLKEALGNMESDVDKMKKLVVKLKNENNEEITVDTLSCLLETLQYYVEDVDLANNLVKIEGVAPVVKLVSHPSPEIRKWAAWIIASLTQNHPKVQLVLTRDFNMISLLVGALTNETDDVATEKQLYALSALISSSKPLMLSFIKDHKGVSVINKLLDSPSSTVHFKTIWFLGKLVAAYPSSLQKSKQPIVAKLVKLLSKPTDCNTEKTASNNHQQRDITRKILEILNTVKNHHQVEFKQLGVLAVLSKIIEEMEANANATGNHNGSEVGGKEEEEERQDEDDREQHAADLLSCRNLYTLLSVKLN